MKAIITDLDRTLLHTDKSISEYTIDIMQKCRQQGIFVFAATARPARTIKQYMKDVHFNAVTTMNGARTLLMERTIDYAIPSQSFKYIISDLMQVEDICISIETNEGIISNRDIPDWKPTVYENLLEAPIPEVVYKIIASSEKYDLSQYIPDILTEDTYYTIADNKLYQIMSCDATKWNGILNMLSDYKLSAKDAVYFGDDNDDMEAMKKCGIGVAVANAIPAVIEIANCITASNDEDGVAKYIEANLLNN